MGKNSVLITGSSRGLGESLALIFAKNNWDIILHGRNSNKLESLKEKLLDYGVDVLIVGGDLRYDGTLDELYEKSCEKNVSVLINNAAVVCPGLALNELSDEKINEMILTNLNALIKLTKRIYRLFLKNNCGKIININSIAGLEPKKFRSIYCASKWGLRGFTNSLRLEAKEKNIGVMGVYLSKMKTLPDDEFGMDLGGVSEKIYKGCQTDCFDDLVIDNRPEEFRPKIEERRY